VAMSERQSPSKVEEWRKLISSLRGRGVEPFPHSFSATHSVKALNELRRQALLEPWVGLTVRTAGRVSDVRRHPNVVFIDLYEDGARFKVMADPKLPLLGAHLAWGLRGGGGAYGEDAEGGLRGEGVLYCSAG
jgi:lysyl-tRNA synthetase class 2